MTLIILSRLNLQRDDFVVRLQDEIYLSLLLAVEIVQFPTMSMEFLSNCIFKHASIIHIYFTLKNAQLYTTGRILTGKQPNVVLK